jgi:RES domain-containing protein
MHSGLALTQAVTACQAHAVPFHGLTYRAIHLRWFDQFATAQPLFTAAGGPGTRYVPPNGPAALHSAFETETAHREMNQTFYHTLTSAAGPALAVAGALRPDPAVVIGVHINVSRVLDLRLPAVLQLLHTNNAQLLAPWKNAANPTATQQLGDAVFQGNWFEGILYPSAQHANYHCLVLFRQRLRAKPAVYFRGFQFQPPPRLTTLADDQLP